ncbi:MAG: AbrB/MazE/SpoVT family DNA-binding domain-containing protein [Candidatus Nanoarchaeia archaeon]|nr:AbrB/MazE/SpoVT family DNA-binding domain-containing protein [Candidatus Nanoarchaeia archaeon]
MEIALTKMSSKGQIVIPLDLRKGIKDGEKLILIKNESQILIKKVSSLGENFKDNLEFAKLTEKAYEKYLKGEFKQLKSEKFLEELKEW